MIRRALLITSCLLAAVTTVGWITSYTMEFKGSLGPLTTAPGWNYRPDSTDVGSVGIVVATAQLGNCRIMVRLPKVVAKQRYFRFDRQYKKLRVTYWQEGNGAILNLMFSFWLPFVVFAGYPALSLCLYVRRRRRLRGCCRACGYSLTGNVSGVCPECGRAIGAVVMPVIRAPGITKSRLGENSRTPGV